jgi:ribosome-associated translation inhibitor RaiA
VRVGLEFKPLTLEEVEELLSGFEQVLRESLEEKLGRRLESLDVIVEAELSPDGKELNLSVDVRATGRLIAPLSYDEVVAEAIDAAARWLERKLRARMAKGKGKGDSRAS